MGLKVADLGSCRGIYSKQPYTEYISTRWYRAPECLLTDGYYGPEMVSAHDSLTTDSLHNIHDVRALPAYT